jgi:acyl dehydratase
MPTVKDMADNPDYDLERLGHWGEDVEFKVDRDQTIAYAKATNDPIDVHLDGTLAPPVFAVVPAMATMAEATMSVVPDDLMLRILHGEHGFRFHRPIEPGEVLTIRAKPIGIDGKRSGVVVTTLMETHSDRGDLVNEQYFIGFFRGGEFSGTVGQASPEHGFPAQLRLQAPDFTVAQRFDADQTFRYAEPAMDPMPIHLDDEFARQMGLPGIIIHGLCTIAFASHALISQISPTDPSTLKRLAVRMSSPGRPGEAIVTSIWKNPDATGDGTGIRSYAFETTGDEKPGKYVLTDGLAEFA